MANLKRIEVCPRCDGDGHVATGPVVGGHSLVKTCPQCGGKGTVEVEKEHSHFAPTELRK